MSSLLTVLWKVQQIKLDSLDKPIEKLRADLNQLPVKDQLPLQKDLLAIEKDRVNAQNAIYTTLVQTLGGIFFFVTAYFTWCNLKIAEANLEALRIKQAKDQSIAEANLKIIQERQVTDRLIAEANLKATEDKQITERFNKAVEQLGSGKIELQLGGIYSLERISKDSIKDHWTVIEVLTSFIQIRSPVSRPLNNQMPIRPITPDIQVILIVIGRRDGNKDQKDAKLDLSNTNLAKANLREACLERADLREADLREAYLGGANLNKADLRDANLSCINRDRVNPTINIINFSGAFLNQANLSEALLSRANFKNANLNKANFTTTVLCQANFTTANLVQTILSGADLSGADFSSAVLSGSDLSGANIQGAKFFGAKGLVTAQIQSAIGWENALYDEAFRQMLGLSENT
ncbi:MAG: pentapeptide repeat-containing protein [Lyngbya sp. HA4199-MV5]|jgi:uncharacterized protein YjbI with pentapeptide repeats|nr:pentapeptide repeat-containing protein [Lyngbya sp. HA4199-MV5]